MTRSTAITDLLSKNYVQRYAAAAAAPPPTVPQDSDDSDDDWMQSCNPMVTCPGSNEKKPSAPAIITPTNNDFNQTVKTEIINTKIAPSLQAPALITPTNCLQTSPNVKKELGTSNVTDIDLPGDDPATQQAIYNSLTPPNTKVKNEAATTPDQKPRVKDEDVRLKVQTLQPEGDCKPEAQTPEHKVKNEGDCKLQAETPSEHKVKNEEAQAPEHKVKDEADCNPEASAPKKEADDGFDFFGSGENLDVKPAAIKTEDSGRRRRRDEERKRKKKKSRKKPRRVTPTNRVTEYLINSSSSEDERPYWMNKSAARRVTPHTPTVASRRTKFFPEDDEEKNANNNSPAGILDDMADNEDAKADDAFFEDNMQEDGHDDLDSSDEEEEFVELPPLSGHEKTQMLARIVKMEDKAYQVLLWRLGFRCCLLNHQFEGSRGVAGLQANFPLQSVTVNDPYEITMAKAVRGLQQSEIRGLLLADDMGLGKTYQAITGAMMHSAIAKATNRPVMPTLVISPNVALIDQWIKELRKNGVTSIRNIKSRHKIGKGFHHDFVFMTRYTLAAETKAILHNCAKSVDPLKQTSSLFPCYTRSFFQKLWRLKRASIGKLKDNLRKNGEHYDDCLTRVVKEELQRNRNKKPVFGLVVIDEAHFLKNRTSFWGIGAAMLGVHANRIIAMTGTPYCNNSGDMAALQTYIDVTDPASRTTWWIQATRKGASRAVVSTVAAWRDQYLIRRRKEAILKDVLKSKHIRNVQVQCYPKELFVYENIEIRLLDMMKSYSKSDNARYREVEMQNVMMAYMTLARGCLVHPLMPNGREATIHFSPSRRHLADKEISMKCVYCNGMSRPTVPLESTVDEEEEEVARGGPGLDFDLEGSDAEDDDVAFRGRKEKDKKLGELVLFPPSYCHVTDEEKKVGHRIHEKCLEAFQASEQTCCPRCIDIGNRLNMLTGTGEQVVPHQRYCSHIKPSPLVSGGFVASSKIELVLNEFKKVPKNEKVLILSFFKGVLDLLEGVIAEDMGIECARYDGDLNQKDRKVELERFKTKGSCRVFLATVHCCGTGLNIVEANHVFFVDRWFNPTVHDQAMDRCYRIGQNKDVHVSFFDSLGTIDIGMMLTNKYKQENSAILLADGTDLGDGAMSFRELSGVMRTLLERLAIGRRSHVTDFGATTPFMQVDDSVMQDMVRQITEIAEAARRKN